jgi:hypothetical protein
LAVLGSTRANTGAIPSLFTGDRLATITLALIAACVAGFAFKTTRGIGIASMCVLILINPLAFVALAVVGGGVCIYLYFR